MMPPDHSSPLAPFRVKSFAFQWPADLATSWAFEMETLILGWYVFTATGSVQLLVLFGAIQWAGSLLSPLFGVAGDRIGHRTLLLLTRIAYAALAAVLMVVSLAGVLAPWQVFAVATLVGLMRPSDLVMRNTIIAQTMHGSELMGALAISRTTADTARIAGALAGAGGVAAFGMGPVYVVVTLLYLVAFGLTLGVARAPRKDPTQAAPATPWRDLVGAFDHVWTRPELLGAMGIAFLVNLLAFPFSMGLLPYVAREIYGVGQAGLGYLAAAFAAGGLVGSVLISSRRLPLRPARSMLVAGVIWLLLIMAFGYSRSMGVGIALLACAGVTHNLCLMPLAAVMLRGADESMRGRVMGMRMLAIWGLPAGMLLAGWLIERVGFVATATLFTGAGVALTIAIGVRWRAALWRPGAPANARL